MIQLAIIGIVAAVIAVLAASWNGGKNPSNPKPPTPKNPNPPTTPNNPNNPQLSPTTPDTLISNPPLLQKNSKGTHELIVAYKTGKIYNPRNSTWDCSSEVISLMPVCLTRKKLESLLKTF